MNKTTLVNKYLDCAKLLSSDPLPDNLSEILIDVIGDTKLFADKLISVRSGIECDSTAGVQERRYNTRNKIGQMTSPTSSGVNTSSNITELKPRVIIKRLASLNGIGSIQDKTKTKTTSALPDKVQPPRIIESDSSDSSEVNFETSEIPQKGLLKPPAVRRIVRRRNTIHSLVANNRSIQDGIQDETKTKTTSALPDKVETFMSPTPVRKLVRRMQPSPISESDSSDSREVNLETGKRQKYEIPETANLKPPAPERRIFRRLQPPRIIESDSSDSSEVNLEARKRPKAIVPEKVNLRPPVRRIVRRMRPSLISRSDSSDSSEVNFETRERATSEIPQKGILKPPAVRRIVRRRNTIHSLVANESDGSDFVEVNLFNRGFSDGCVIC